MRGETTNEEDILINSEWMWKWEIGQENEEQSMYVLIYLAYFPIHILSQRRMRKCDGELYNTLVLLRFDYHLKQ